MELSYNGLNSRRWVIHKTIPGMCDFLSRLLMSSLERLVLNYKTRLWMPYLPWNTVMQSSLLEDKVWLYRSFNFQAQKWLCCCYSNHALFSSWQFSIKSLLVQKKNPSTKPEVMGWNWGKTVAYCTCTHVQWDW